jgi:ABC-type lipoprotein export system ATPase subunit
MEHNAAVVCVTHDPRLEGFADRIIHLEDGRVQDADDLDPPRSGHPALVDAVTAGE